MDISAEEYLEKYDKIIAEARHISEDKSKIYGVTSIGELGMAGEFVQIHRKYKRLKNMIWDGDLAGVSASKYNDTIRDTLLDMINYCVIMLIVHEDEIAVKTD